MLTHAKKLGVIVAAAILVAALGPVGSAQERVQGPRRVVKTPQPATPATTPQEAPAPQPTPTPAPVPTNTDPVVTPPILEPPPIVVMGPVEVLPPTAPPPQVSAQAAPPERVRTFTVVAEAPVAPARMVEPQVEEALAARHLTRFELGYPSPVGPPILVAFDQSVDLPPTDTSINPATHPAVGSWFGRAVEVCPQGVAPSACANGQAASALYMTPTLTADGLFLGNDSFALLPAPFGPHTTAHGSWTPTSTTEFTAEYVFMANTYPPTSNATVTGYRFRWQAQVISSDTAVGYVNLYVLPAVPIVWTPLQPDEFPSLPSEALAVVTPPVGVVKDPSTCMTAGCPLVFKFTIKRVTR